MSKIRVAIATATAVSKFKGERLSFADDYVDEDENYDESIPILLLRGVLHNLGGRLTKKEIDALVIQDNSDTSTLSISHEQFSRIVMLTSLMISVFDRKGNGSISGKDLTKALINFTDTYSKEQICALVKAAQTRSDDKIHYKTFVKLVETTR